MYLADLKAKIAPRYTLTQYSLYIAFFPQVLAGPLVRWREIMHQFDEKPYELPDAAARFSRGCMLLIIGLCKKVFLADPLSQYVNPVFQLASEGSALSMASAWQATLGFTFQIYFDFSGYTDMALGIALMFGIILPQNFKVPYRATSLRDFWRRWHMTLSRFLRDYLYIPLGGNRHGIVVQVVALFVTMSLGGLWHGAGLTFVAWGVMHGLGLGVGILWRRLGWPMPVVLGWLCTMMFVIMAWVLFRAQTFDTAIIVYKGLFGLGPPSGSVEWSLLIPAAIVAMLGPTSWDAVHKIPPWRSIALAFAVVFVFVLYKIADDTNYEFIYFRF